MRVTATSAAWVGVPQRVIGTRGKWPVKCMNVVKCISTLIELA